MAHNGRRGAAAWLIGLWALAAPAAGSAADHTVVLEVQGSRVSKHYLEAAQREAADIYDGVGVSLLWVDPGTATVSRASLRLRVLLVMQVDAGFSTAVMQPTVLGVALLPHDRVYIFYDRVVALARSTRQDIGVILGRVLAHEVGHVLLGEGHSSTGLMQARVDASSTAPSFSALERDGIRRRLAAPASR